MSGSDYFFTNSYDSRSILVANILRLPLLYGKINIMISSLSGKLSDLNRSDVILDKGFHADVKLLGSTRNGYRPVRSLMPYVSLSRFGYVSAFCPRDFHLRFHFHFRRNAYKVHLNFKGNVILQHICT